MRHKWWHLRNIQNSKKALKANSIFNSKIVYHQLVFSNVKEYHLSEQIRIGSALSLVWAPMAVKKIFRSCTYFCKSLLIFILRIFVI